MLKRITIAVLAVAMMALAGCGSDESSTAPATTAAPAATAAPATTAAPAATAAPATTAAPAAADAPVEADGYQAAHDELLAAANEEGSLFLYGDAVPAQLEQMVNGFMTAYPDIDVEYVRAVPTLSLIHI